MPLPCRRNEGFSPINNLDGTSVAKQQYNPARQHSTTVSFSAFVAFEPRTKLANHSISTKQGFFSKLKAAYSPASQYTEVRLMEIYKLQGASIRVPFEGYPIELSMGKKLRLHLYPEQPFGIHEPQDNLNFILFNQLLQEKVHFLDLGIIKLYNFDAFFNF